jgi:hypothetical protein
MCAVCELPAWFVCSPHLREAKVSLQAKIRLYEDHAKDCVEVAGRTDNPAHREILVKEARDSMKDAAALQAVKLS